MKTNVVRFLPIAIALAIVFAFGASLHGALTEQQVTSLKRRVLSDPGDDEKHRDALKACDEALAAEAYSVFVEAVAHGRDGGVQNYVMLDLLEKMPGAEKKLIIKAALSNSSMWPNRAKVEVMKTASGNEAGITFIRQIYYCDVISRTYGTKIDYKDFWTEEERMTLVAKLSALDTAPRLPSPSATPENPILRPTPQAIPEAIAPSSTVPPAATPEIKQEQPKTKASFPLPWIVIGLTVILAGAWFFLRINQSNKSR